MSQLGTSGFNYNITGTGVSTGVGLGTIADPDLKWESTAQVLLEQEGCHVEQELNFAMTVFVSFDTPTIKKSYYYQNND